MRARSFVSAAALCGTLVACGGGSGGGGGGTTGPTPTPSSLAISPATDLIKLRGSETFTATVTLSNGTTQVVTATWRSSNGSVLTIDSGGRATAVASGTASVTAEYQGITSPARSIRVVPDYQGTWRGEMVVRTCSATGEWAAMDACEDLEPGSTDTLRITITQANAGVSSASLDLGGFAGSVNGSIADGGGLILTGNYIVTFDGVPFRMTVVEWQTTSSDNSTMSGRFVFTMDVPNALTGEVRVEVELRGVSKTSTTFSPMEPARPGRIAGAVSRILRRR